jgi:hypothetical protein
MSNPFLTSEFDRDVETAILLEKAIRHDIKDAVAFTNEKGDIFVNTDDNLTRILPDYNDGMLKWLLWHEQYHCLLSHANRFFKYLQELKETELLDKFYVTKEEANIIMDILVHDIMSEKFPELVETAKKNLAQFRNRNSLGHTFTTTTLEEMIDEYAKTKKPPEDSDGSDKSSSDDSSTDDEEKDSDGMGTSSEGKDGKDKKDSKKKKDDPAGKSSKKGHAEGGSSASPSEKGTKPEEPAPGETPAPPEEPSEHEDTDWSKLKDIDPTEFIDEDTTSDLKREANKLRQRKLKLGRLAKKLNGLATTTKERTYSRPSLITIDKDTILKGKRQGKADLYLVFDASGSMSYELDTFKKLITEAIPQALDCPCEWFSGRSYDKPIDHLKNDYKYQGRSQRDYYKGKFRDILSVSASSGYDDDGDRVIDLCIQAEQKGFTPIGVTDGGGGIYNPEKLKKLKRTILIGTSERWLQRAHEINPAVQVQCI